MCMRENEWQYQALTQLHDRQPQSLYSISVYIYGEVQSEANIGLKFDKVTVCDISLDFGTYFVGCTMK